ncbi:MAG: tetratricopeptide repeat protein [Planctomycetes bacterium]|nr:tetratricopeptide repeat protein [Planctomycetota bacterium]
MVPRSRLVSGPRSLAGCAALALFAACAPKLELAPVVLADTRSIDPEVLELVRVKVEAATRSRGDARAHGVLGLVYSANGLWEAAEGSLANATRLAPDDPWWRVQHAIALREAGDGARAKTELAEVARALPSEAGVQQRLAQWLLEEGDVAGARAGFERALALVPDQPDLLVGLAGAFVAREDWKTGFDLAARALRRDPSAKSAHYQAGLALRGLGRAAEAERELALGLGAKPRWIDDPSSREAREFRVSFVAQVGDATDLMLQGKHALALPILERVLAKRPDDVNVLGNAAACLQETGNPARGLELLKRALVLDDQAFATHLNLVDAYVRLKQLDDAERHAVRSCQLAPELGRAHLARARVLMLKDQFEPAYLALRESARLDANNPTVYVALVEACAKLMRADEARAWCQRAVELDPLHLPSRVNLAYMTLVAGDLDAAKAQVDELVRIAPENERVQALKRELEARGR